MHDNAIKQQQSWYNPFSESHIIVNGVFYQATTDQHGTLHFTLRPKPEPGVVEGTITYSEIVPSNETGR